MSYNREDYVKIKAEFSQKYLLAHNRARERQVELYEKLPEVWEIDRLLSKTGMEIMAVIAEGVDVEKRIGDIREKNEHLQRERGRILREGGFPEDYSDVRYECELCGDTGYVDTKMCDCMKRALVMAGYQSSGLGALIGSQTFENLSLDYYKNHGGNYDMVAYAVQALKEFSLEFDGDTYRNYLLIGGTGLGKTHISTAVAKNVIERGYDVLYVTAVGMFRDFEAKQFEKGVGMKNDPARYEEADLLIIDDLGTEVTNQFTVSCLYDVINARINLHRPTFINTNLSSKDLETRYHERITSRLFGEYQPIMFRGTDIRRQKMRR